MTCRITHAAKAYYDKLIRGGGTQIWFGYGSTGQSFNHHPITKPEKTKILQPMSESFVSWRAFLKTYQYFLPCELGCIGPGGGTDLERGYGDVRPLKTPLFTPLLPLARVPFQAKESVHKTPFWENLEILASIASIFTQILAHKPPNLEISAHKPPNLEIFSSQAPKFGNFPLTSPPFQRQMSVRKPHTSEIRAAHPYLKKVECPPSPGA